MNKPNKLPGIGAILLSGSCFVLFALSALSAPEPDWVYSVQASATVQASPPQITLHWEQDDFGAASYTIYRKAKTANSWGSPIANLAGSATSYADAAVSVGSTYEYQIVKIGSLGYTAYGYVYSGVMAGLTDDRGKLILLVATNATASLGSELARLQTDLTGDGWQVIRHDVSSNDSPAYARSLVVSDYNADPGKVNAVFLFGHVPILQSGFIDYDGHGPRPMPADGYYGDVNGDWSGSPSYLPSDAELMVGRVDLADMPGAGAASPWPSETELLRNYLNKDHRWRFKQMNVPRRALIADRFGTFNGETRASSGYRNLEPFVGPGNSALADVSDTAPANQRWISLLSAGSYLWTYGNGGGQDTSISELGLHGQYDDVWSTDLVAQDPKTVFFMLEGSHFGNWDHPDNIMRSVLAMPTMGLEVCCIAGHPQWYLHHMGLGEPIGYSVRLTMNDTTLYRDTTNLFSRAVYIALMGDPTLRMDPIGPASNLRSSASGGNVTLNWGASSDGVAGYHVYRAASPAGPFTRLTSSLVTGLSYDDSSAPSGDSTYMVRAVALQTNPSGSYFNPSQGVFTTLTVDTTSGGTNNPFVPVSGTFNGLFFEADQVRETSAGAFSVSINSRGAYSGHFQLAARRYSFGGKVSAEGFATNVLMHGQQTLDLVLRFGANAESDQVFGTLTDGTWVANLSGDRAQFNARSNPASWAGRYTLILPGVDGNPSLPAGDGYATINVGLNGQVSAAITLADGTKVMQSAPLSKNGMWPLYASLYSGQGSIVSWLAFADRADDDINGTLNWIKPANSRARYYPDGFTEEITAAGSRYNKPTGTNHIVSLDSAQLTFSGGDLPADFSNTIALGAAGHATNQSSNRLSLSFSTATGRFSGSVVPPAGGKSMPFSGVVFQKLNSGSGFLLGTNQSSRVTLGP